MSEQEPKTMAQPAKVSGTGASAVAESAGKASPAASESKPATAPRRASSGIAWLALLLVIALAAATAWLVREGLDRETALAQRVAELETISRQKQASLDALSERWQQELRTGLADLEATVGDETSRLSQSLESAEVELAKQQKELGRFSASDRDSWLLTEAGHLLRLANQRLVMAADPVAAQALLNSADAVLRELDDTSLHTVRAAVAADIAALRAVPTVDVEGIYLSLAALIDQADTLVIFQLPEPVAQPEPEVAKDWQGRLRQGFKAALSQLSDYIIVRRRDVPMQALMDPQTEGLVRQNLRMLLEQAQVALLSGDQSVYVASLQRAKHWVAQFRESDETNARAISSQIARLEELTIQVPQPDISASQHALDEAIERRLQAAGGQ